MATEPNSSKRKIKLNRNRDFDYDDSLKFLATGNRKTTTLHHSSSNSALTPPNIGIDANPGYAQSNWAQLSFLPSISFPIVSAVGDSAPFD